MANYEQKDNNSFGFSGTTGRAKVTTDFRDTFAVTTTETELLKLDSAQFGGVSCCMTVFNRAASAASVRIRAYVSNDNFRTSTNTVALANVYDETDTTVSLPKTIAAGAAFHFIFGYKQQPQLTTFRFWKFTVDVAANTATVDAYINAK